MRWFTGEKSKAQRMAETACKRTSSASKQLRKDLKELKRVQKKTEALLERVGLIAETTAEDVEDCEKRLAYSEKALEALRSELEICSEVELPRMSTALKRFQASDEAAIAISNHRRAGATPVPLDGEMR
jgi:chromosome segregation ATPase